VPESFQSLLLRHRGRTGLTQRQLAARAGVSRRSVQDWEAGLNYPEAQHLQALIIAFLQSGGLTVGHEATEAETLWNAAMNHAPRMQTPFDAVWWAGAALAPANEILERRQDWGEAPDVLGFVGRTRELATLREWVLEERCRLVVVLGMGGIGKTMLAARVAEEVASAFQRVYWRSLRNAPSFGEWLAGAIGFLSGQQVVPPAGEAARLTALLKLLHDRRNLLVLDNFETLLEPGQQDARLRDNLDGYGQLLRAIGEGRHQSCLLVTSREAPRELAVVGTDAVRSFQLSGFSVADSQALIAGKHLSGDPADWATLISRFGGNGLALKVVGESVRQVFGGDIRAFLEESESGAMFGGIRRLIAEQIGRSSELEQRVLRELAVEREPLNLGELVAGMGPRVGRGALLEAIEALRRRSLAERADAAGRAAFTLQSVVLEYVTERLVEDVGDEITRGRPVQMVDQPIIKAQAKEYVRQTQERLIGTPILQHLRAAHGNSGTEQLLLALLDVWRDRLPVEQGYGPGNAVNLLRQLRGHLRGLDLSRLALRQAYLAGVEAQDASLAGAHVSEVALAEAFNFPIPVTLSSDGAFLVTGTVAGEVWLWRVADRTPLLASQGHTSPVYGAAVSADGRLLASGGLDGTMRLWEAPSGRLLAAFEGHAGGLWCLALSADGRVLVSGGVDGTVRLWDASTAGQGGPTGQLLATLSGHTGGIWGLTLSSDGRLLASASEDGTIRLWATSGGQLLATLQAHTGAVYGVAMSADARLLASAGADGTVRLWQVRDGRLLATLQRHTGLVLGVALSADGRLLASCGLDGTVRLWETSGGQLLATLQEHTGGVRRVALTADGLLMASGGQDGTVRLWETHFASGGARVGSPGAPSGHLLATLQGHASGLWGVALSADARLLVSGAQDGTVRLWDAVLSPGADGRPLTVLRGHSGTVAGVAVSADGRLLASAGLDGTVRLWTAPSGQPMATLRGHTNSVRGVALSADGRLLVSGGEDATIRLWETSEMRLLRTLYGHSSGVSGVALTQDGRRVASGGLDETVRLWEAASGRLFRTLQGHSGPVYCVAMCAAGHVLVSGGADATVRLWDPATGRLLTTLCEHTGMVWAVALSADGQLLASGGLDGTVRLWKVQSGRLLATLQGHTAAVWGVALSADGQLLASSSLDGTIRLWESSTGTQLRTLRSDRRYERLDITGLTGVTAAQRAALLSLGALEYLPAATNAGGRLGPDELRSRR
jgi:WD40 repeat protein/transcriptional regulator with XRE-family HTH domain